MNLFVMRPSVASYYEVLSLVEQQVAARSPVLLSVETSSLDTAVELLFEAVGQFSITFILLNARYTLIAIFTPEGKLLSDVKWSRYRAVLYSSRVIIVMLCVLH